MYNGYKIKQQAAAIAAAITPDAESASLLREALLRISQEPDIPDVPAYAGFVDIDSIAEIFRAVIGGRRGWNPYGDWREYRLDRNFFRNTLCFHNIGYGSRIWISYSWGNSQEINEVAFETMFGGGRIYRPTDEGGLKIYRTKCTVECLTPELEEAE